VPTKPNIKNILLVVFIISVAISLGYEGYSYWQLYQENARRGEQLSQLQESFSAVEADLARVKSENSSITQALQAEQGKSSDLSSVLQSEQSKNQIFETQIGDLSKTVGTLQKLTTTDPELLQKYSKVYFLSENYSPANLSAIGSQYLYNKNKPQLIHSGVSPYLESLLSVADRDGTNLRVISGYRSFYEQSTLKSGYQIVYGSGANRFSADQGYSEHQLGTAVDFTTTVLGENFSQFKGTTAYKWLGDNAWRYGFVLSYPEGNQYYIFEPWHWRFVGVSLATKLHGSSQFFYNLTQREIDTYLVSIFD